jgi:hypothetical protein
MRTIEETNEFRTIQTLNFNSTFYQGGFDTIHEGFGGADDS